MPNVDSLDEETLRLVRKIARNIKATRVAKGLTQADMANFGFGSRWYQRLESGRHVPTIPTLYKLCRALEMDMPDLFK